MAPGLRFWLAVFSCVCGSTCLHILVSYLLCILRSLIDPMKASDFHCAWLFLVVKKEMTPAKLCVRAATGILSPVYFSCQMQFFIFQSSISVSSIYVSSSLKIDFSVEHTEHVDYSSNCLMPLSTYLRVATFLRWSWWIGFASHTNHNFLPLHSVWLFLIGWEILETSLHTANFCIHYIFLSIFLDAFKLLENSWIHLGLVLRFARWEQNSAQR